MFIAGILPALFACVLGADVPVLQLLANSNITLPFIGIRKSQSVLHANAVIQERSKSTSCEPGEPGPKASFVSWPADTTFTFLFFGIPRPQSVFLGDVAIRKGSTSHPCEEGEPCYQSLSTREYAVVYGFHNVGKGIIVAYPVDKTKSPSAIIVQKKGDTSADPSIPGGVDVTKRIELDTTLAYIWYSDRVQHTRLSGNIEFNENHDPSKNVFSYSEPYKVGDGDELSALILTGRIRNTVIYYKLMYSESLCEVLGVAPSDNLDELPTTYRVAFSGVHHLKPWKILLCLLPAIITKTMP